MNTTNDNLQITAFIEAAPFAFGRHLAGLRKVRGWSQEKLALESGMARSYLGGIERGHRNVSLKNLVKLAKSLNIPAPVLMNFSVDENLVQIKLKTLMLKGSAVQSMSTNGTVSIRSTGSVRRRESEQHQTRAKTQRTKRSMLHEGDVTYNAESPDET